MTQATKRVEATALLTILAYVSRNRGVAGPELAELVGVSISTLYRILQGSEKQFGVKIKFHRDNSMPSSGQYQVDDWGVFNKRRVLDSVSI